MARNAKLIILFFSALIITQLSCIDPCSDTVDPPLRGMAILLQDSLGKNLLDSIYTEELYEFTESSSNRIVFASRRSFIENSYLLFGFEGTLQNTDYYIIWDASDTDTLSFQWDTIDRECFDSYELTKVKHNNVEVDFNFESGFEDAKITLIQ